MVFPPLSSLRHGLSAWPGHPFPPRNLCYIAFTPCMLPLAVGRYPASALPPPLLFFYHPLYSLPRPLSTACILHATCSPSPALQLRGPLGAPHCLHAPCRASPSLPPSMCRPLITNARWSASSTYTYNSHPLLHTCQSAAVLSTRFWHTLPACASCLLLPPFSTTTSPKSEPLVYTGAPTSLQQHGQLEHTRAEGTEERGVGGCPACRALD